MSEVSAQEACSAGIGDLRNYLSTRVGGVSLDEAAVFLADMGATHAGKNTELMAEGRALGTAVLELSRSKMPVHTKDLAISGHDVLALLEDKSKIRDAMRYLLQRVQSTNLPNERSALEEAVRGWQKRH